MSVQLQLCPTAPDMSQPEEARAELGSKDTLARVCLLPACQFTVSRTGPLLPVGQYCCFPPHVQHSQSEASCRPHGGAGHVPGMPRSFPTWAKTSCCLLQAQDPGRALPDRSLQAGGIAKRAVGAHTGFVPLGNIEPPWHDAAPELAC